MLDKSASFISTQVTSGEYYYLNMTPGKDAREVVVCGGREQCAPDYRIERRTFKGGSRYHFTYSGSTHCWEYERQPGLAAIREMVNSTYSANRTQEHKTRALKIVLNRLSEKNQGLAYRKTFFTGDDITRSGYDIGASPIVYPGQTLTATLHLSVGEGVSARLFARDYASFTAALLSS